MLTKSNLSYFSFWQAVPLVAVFAAIATGLFASLVVPEQYSKIMLVLPLAAVAALVMVLRPQIVLILLIAKLAFAHSGGITSHIHEYIKI